MGWILGSVRNVIFNVHLFTLGNYRALFWSFLRLETWHDCSSSDFVKLTREKTQPIVGCGKLAVSFLFLLFLEKKRTYRIFFFRNRHLLSVKATHSYHIRKATWPKRHLKWNSYQVASVSHFTFFDCLQSLTPFPSKFLTNQKHNCFFTVSIDLSVPKCNDPWMHPASRLTDSDRGRRLKRWGSGLSWLRPDSSWE